MFNYIKGELFRIFCKKGFYVYYVTIMVVVLGLFLISGVGDSSHMEMGMMFTSAFLPMSMIFFGTNLFLLVYGDDLANRSLSLVLSTGLSRTAFVLSKLIVMMVATLVVYVAMGVYSLLIWQLAVGSLPAFDSVEVVLLLKSFVVVFLQILGFGSIAGALSYFYQKNTGGIVMYSVMALGLTYQIGNLLTALFDWLKEPVKYMLYAQANKVQSVVYSGESISLLFVGIAIGYIVVGMTIQSLVLSKREISVS